MNIRHYSWIDRILIEADAALMTLCAKPESTRPTPTAAGQQQLSEKERQQSAALMRVNHSGEVCAQALYQGQLCVARTEAARNMFKLARDEELDHLAWTSERIQELNGHLSYLNFCWYFNSFLIGVIAGLCGDAWSLGFVEETEKQVAKHLSKHLERLPKKDIKSQKILEQMREDEKHHGASAKALGAVELPIPIQFLMQCHAKVMTTIAYWV